MFIQLDDYVTMYQLPSGRAVHAGRKVAAAARAGDVASIVTRADAFLAAANATHDLELRYRRAQSTPQYGPGAAALDARIDRALGALDRMVSGYAELADDPETPPQVSAAATKLSAELFPRGVTYITLMSYAEEYEAVRKLVARLGGAGDLSAAVSALSLEPFVASLTKLNAAFGAELDRAPKVDGPSWDQIRASRAMTHARALELVAVVLGTYPDADDASATQRTAILAPLMVQQRALAALYRSRQGGRDINPDTGELAPTAPDTPIPPPQQG